MTIVGYQEFVALMEESSTTRIVFNQYYNEYVIDNSKT